MGSLEIPYQIGSIREEAQFPWLESPLTPTYSTARHEVMHGIAAEWWHTGNVVSIDVVPEGNVLGKTVIRASHPAIAATGLVHGEGYGSDYASIVRDAIDRGSNPAIAVEAAQASARGILGSVDEKIVNLVSQKLAYFVEMTGDEFRDSIFEAKAILNQPQKNSEELSVEDSATDYERLQDEVHMEEAAPEILIIETLFDSHREVVIREDGRIAGKVIILPDKPITNPELKKYLDQEAIQTVTHDERTIPTDIIVEGSGIDAAADGTMILGDNHLAQNPTLADYPVM